jgi:hypothetical protein
MKEQWSLVDTGFVVTGIIFIMCIIYLAFKFGY